jgi:trimethylamine-N-oxide reductase (cytochrome c)
MQHKCIEPLGESKSDYQIFQDVLARLGLSSVFTEGCDELGWVKRVFDSSDLPRHISWKKFVKKGYFVVPAEQEALRSPVNMRWFAEGRRKDVPEPHPLPSQFSERYGYGLQTPSGKIEFVPTILKRMEADFPDRPALNRYTPSWEGPKARELADRFPLQMIATHSRYSFHTYSDGKGFTDRIKDHRVLKDGHYYWIVRMHSQDAVKRGIKQHDLVKVFNDRGIIICAADIADTVAPGVMKSYEASSKFQLLEVMGETVDIGGCLNMLTPDRPQVARTHSMSPNSTLVEIVKYEHVAALNQARAGEVQAL